MSTTSFSLHLPWLAALVVALAAAPARADDAAPPGASAPAHAPERRPASRSSRTFERRLAALERSEPSLAHTRAAALRHAGLDHDPGPSWARRARLAGLAPRLTLRTTRGRAHDEDLSRASTGSERLDIGTDVDIGYEARAVWDLDRLLFDPAELRAASEAQRLHRLRLQLGAEVTRAYVRRRRLQIEWLARPPADPTESALRRLEIDELTAVLDGLTGGFFSGARDPRISP